MPAPAVSWIIFLRRGKNGAVDPRGFRHFYIPTGRRNRRPDEELALSK
jgi:hypothetical protein